MESNCSKISASNNGTEIETGETIFSKTYTKIGMENGIKSSYLVVYIPHISEIRQNGNRHNTTIHPSSTQKIVKKRTGIQPILWNSVIARCTSNKYISIPRIIQEHVDTCIKTSRIRKLNVVTLPHAEEPSAMVPGILSSLLQVYKRDSIITALNNHENRIRKYKLPVQVAFEGNRSLCNTLRATEHQIITVRDGPGSHTTYLDTQWIILSQSTINAYGQVSTYYVLFTNAYKSNSYSKLFLQIRQNALPSTHVPAIQHSPDIQQLNAIRPYFTDIGRSICDTNTSIFSIHLYMAMKMSLEKQILEIRRTIADAKKTTEPSTHVPAIQHSPDIQQLNAIRPIRPYFIDIGRSICDTTTSIFSIHLYMAMKMSLEKQILEIRRTIADAKKSTEHSTHFSIENDGNQDLVIRADSSVIHASTDMAEIRPVDKTQQQCTKAKQANTYNVIDEQICVGHTNITRVSELTPEEPQKIWSTFNKICNMDMSHIFTPFKKILSLDRVLGSNKSSNIKIQQATERTRRLVKQKKHYAVRRKLRNPRPNIEYEWTMFFPTHENISEKGGLCYLLHYKIKTKHAIEKPTFSFKLPTITKPVSIPHISFEDRKTTISGTRSNTTTLENTHIPPSFNNYFVVHCSVHSEKDPVPRNINEPYKNRVTKDSTFQEKSTTFFKSYQDLNITSLLGFQYHFRQ